MARTPVPEYSYPLFKSRSNPKVEWPLRVLSCNVLILGDSQAYMACVTSIPAEKRVPVDGALTGLRFPTIDGRSVGVSAQSGAHVFQLHRNLTTLFRSHHPPYPGPPQVLLLMGGTNNLGDFIWNTGTQGDIQPTVERFVGQMRELIDYALRLIPHIIVLAVPPVFQDSRPTNRKQRFLFNSPEYHSVRAKFPDSRGQCQRDPATFALVHELANEKLEELSHSYGFPSVSFISLSLAAKDMRQDGVHIGHWKSQELHAAVYEAVHKVSMWEAKQTAVLRQEAQHRSALMTKRFELERQETERMAERERITDQIVAEINAEFAAQAEEYRKAEEVAAQERADAEFLARAHKDVGLQQLMGLRAGLSKIKNKYQRLQQREKRKHPFFDGTLPDSPAF